MTKLEKMPEFKALEAAVAALLPLTPEGRRKVVEAIHSLLEISEGKAPSHGLRGPGEPAAKERRKKRRR